MAKLRFIAPGWGGYPAHWERGWVSVTDGLNLLAPEPEAAAEDVTDEIKPLEEEAVNE